MTDKPGARTPQQEARDRAIALLNLLDEEQCRLNKLELIEEFEERGRLEGLEEAVQKIDEWAEAAGCGSPAAVIRSLGRKG